MINAQIDHYRQLAQMAALAHDVPERLLVRIADVESAWNPWATRYEPNFNNLTPTAGFKLSTTRDTELQHQRTSWGLCQIMGATAREMGWRGPLPALCDPATNFDIGANYLRHLHDSNNSAQPWRWAITAYNHSPRWEKIDQAWWSIGYTAKFVDILDELIEP